MLVKDLLASFLLCISHIDSALTKTDNFDQGDFIKIIELRQKIERYRIQYQEGTGFIKPIVKKVPMTAL